MTTQDNTNPEATVPESSEKAITNPATQTLFRFVSLRNPQLTESIGNIGFITRPKLDIDPKGHFDLAIEAWAAQNPKTGTKFQALELAAASFEALKSEKDVRKVNTQYYDLGKSLSKNEDVGAKSPFEITDESLAQLWDNLIYQVVTQKDFYVKEAIIQTLKAVHYTKHNSYEATASQAKNAKVVLPAKLFVEDAPVTDEEDEEKALFTVGETEIGSQDHIAGTGGGAKATRSANPVAPRSLSVAQESRLRVNAEKNLQITKALIKKSMLQTLKKELEKLQKSYSKAYYKTYNSDLAKYQSEAQPIIERNNKILDELEATFDETTTEVAKKQAYENLELTDVPRFEFTYKSEINFPDLKAKLSSESFNILLEQVAEYDAAEVAKKTQGRQQDQQADLQILSDTELSVDGESVVLGEDYTSYQEIFTKLDEEISAQSKTALSAVEMPKQQYVNLGGALVPVAKASSSQHLAYTFFPMTTSNFFWTYGGLNFSFEVENSSWSVASGKIVAKTDTGNYENSFSNISVIDNVVTLPGIITSYYTIVDTIKIEIYFENGRETTLELQNIDGNDTKFGFLNLKSLSGSTSANGMTPKHFGVKRLGIADYLKVEQSIHAYVPGEVSNIENVMASELRHKSSVARDYSEITDTTSKSEETEKMSDTTKTSRTDMQTEVAKEIDKQQSIEAHTSFSAGGAKWKLEVGGSYANSTAQHDSTRQAVAKSQELTERAMERVLTKISEERVQKIIKEYTETNVHEFDNRGKATVAGTQTATPQHITGVYRWVDKKMKNQIYNYGKRTMFEFMIPEPARLHKLALGSSSTNILTAPNDPRDAEGEMNMTSNNITEEKLQHWADVYKVTLSANPYKEQLVTFNFDGTQSNTTQLPADFICTKAHVMVEYDEKRSNHMIKADNFKGDFIWISYYGQQYDATDLSLKDSVTFNYMINEIKTINFYIKFYCQTNPDIMNQWRQTNFEAIIAAYDIALKDFKDAQAAADAQAQEDEDANKEKVSLYYRDMEAEVLKHNCIAYLLQDLGGYGALGTDLTNGLQTMTDFAVRFDGDLDAYTSLAKFMEQAMEWSVMDYTFYPYYWGNKANWQEMYLSSDLDPLFRNFLQAGMARVIVTVKPGFEDAVQFFMSTGKIWNGGEVPVIGDPMYLSIVDEMREPTGKAQGKYWITRVPTALTILQAGSVGLKVDDALPIFPESHPEECENPLELETKSSFGKPIDAVMQHGDKESTLG